MVTSKSSYSPTRGVFKALHPRGVNEKRVMLFGGAFDPRHLGHQLVIEQVFKQVNPDELWLLPCYEHTFLKEMTASQQRIKMTKLLVEVVGDARVSVCTIEIKQRSEGSTYQTWLWLKEKYPQIQFSFVMGSDNLLMKGSFSPQICRN